MEAFYIRSLNGDPFYNLAVEEHMLNTIPGGRMVFFIWQSDRAVVIGRNQNPWREAAMEFILEHGVMLARRTSGGGAVYQDRGNLNFSFIADRRLYDSDRQFAVVRGALESLGIAVEVSRRKDLLVHGKKISGSAYAIKRLGALHHGTLLVDSDLGMMESLRSKLRITDSRGTSSERSEVENLKSVAPGMNVETVVAALRSRFEAGFGTGLREYSIEELCDAGELSALIDKHRSWEWRFGTTPAFRADIVTRDAELGLYVDHGRVGRIVGLPGEEVLFDAGGMVRFHREEVGPALWGAGAFPSDPHVADIF